MRYYQGNPETDILIGGGKYPGENKYGIEMFNFLPIDGRYYGAFGWGDLLGKENEKKLNLKRIGGNENDEFVSEVLVIWTASERKNKGTVIVGWYKNATVFKKYQISDFPERKFQDKMINYNIVTNTQDAFLIEAQQRNFVVPRRKKGFMGQKPIWYADSEEAKDLVKEVISYIGKFEENSDIGIEPQINDELTGYDRIVIKELKNHLRYERDFLFVRKYKEKYKEIRECPACGINPYDRYGIDDSKMFFELHHITPLHKVKVRNENLLLTEDDVVLLCPSCHRAIHRMMSENKLNTITLNEFKKNLY